MAQRLLNLRAKRQKATLTQLELANQSGVKRESISLIENGRPARPATQRALAEALGCAPSDLLGDDLAGWRKALTNLHKEISVSTPLKPPRAKTP